MAEGMPEKRLKLRDSNFYNRTVKDKYCVKPLANSFCAFRAGGKVLLEICTPDIRISRISAGYHGHIKRITKEN